MLNERDLDTIRQDKFNALVAIELHRKEIRKLQQKNQLIDSLTLAVPVFYLIPRLLAKGTFLASFIDGIGEILAGILLVLAILKLTNKWQEREIRHTTMSRRNRDIFYEADRLLKSQTASREVVEQFQRRVIDVDNEDETLLSNLKEVDRQKGYREVLKKFIPGTSTPCPQCGADPWKFTPGTCQLCGGTPVQQKTN